MLAVASRVSLGATGITVGTTQLLIPAPDGYELVTKDMEPYFGVAQRFVPPSNEQFALFLTSSDVSVAARGGIPEPQRWFYVQTQKSLISQFITTSEFARFKQTQKAEGAQQLAIAKAKVPKLLEGINQGVEAEFGADLSLSIEGMVPLPPHFEDERRLAFSMLLKYNLDGEGGRPTVIESVVTATFIHIRGKVLFFYAASEKGSLALNRSESERWTSAVVAANPSVGEVALRESEPPKSGINWHTVAEKAVQGAIFGAIGGAIVGVLSLFRRKKVPKT